MLQVEVNKLFDQQLQEWDLARDNYSALGGAHRKSFTLDGELSVDLQYNAARITSSTAKVDEASVQERKCFLCTANLPSPQRMVDFGKEYVILVNPFPIFPRHLTIPHRNHTDQKIKGRMGDMLQLARELSEYVVFYNGPKCGASAPDHLHFQAGNKGFLPIEEDWGRMAKTIIKGTNGCRALSFENYFRHCIILQGDNPGTLIKWFEQIYRFMQKLICHHPEPMMNILATYTQGNWQIFIFPRKMHRPWQYFSEGDQNILLSPGSVDMGGAIILPREKDYNKIGISDITDIFEQVSWDKKEFDLLTAEFKLD